MAAVELGGLRIAYERFGQGPARPAPKETPATLGRLSPSGQPDPGQRVRRVGGFSAPSMFSAVPAERVRAFAESMSPFSRVGSRVMTYALAEADLRSVLPKITVPTLLVYGGQDVRAPQEVAEAIHAAVPHSELVWLPEAGHALCVEAPEEFNAAVRRFLRGSLSDPRR